MLTVVLLAVIIFCVLFHNFYWKRRNLPPGPIPLPLIGNTLQMKFNDPYKCFFKFAEDYGDIHTLWMGNTPMVMISSAEKIQEYFVKHGEAFSGRQKHSPIMHDLARGGKYGVIFTDGDLWRETRRFTLRVLRDFGMGKNVMQERILNEVDWMIQKLKIESAGENDLDIQNYIDLTVGSVINGIIYGFGISDESRQVEFFEQRKRFEKAVETMGNPIIQALLFSESSFTFNLPVISGVMNQWEGDLLSFKEGITKQVEQRKKIFVEDSEPENFIDAFLKEMKLQGAASDIFTENQLIITTMDLWIAGHHTTSITVTWGIYYLATNPEIQDRLHAELDREIGSDQSVTLSDKAKLPFTNAIIMETQRQANILPVNLPHRLLEPVTVGEYTLPADTIVVSHIGPAMHQKKSFPKPLVFNPDRYLDENGNFVPLSEVMPFGIGKRSCAGEALARAELFLIVANFFNQFRVTMSKNQKQLVSESSILGRAPPDYRVKLHPRW